MAANEVTPALALCLQPGQWWVGGVEGHCGLQRRGSTLPFPQDPWAFDGGPSELRPTSVFNSSHCSFISHARSFVTMLYPWTLQSNLSIL